MWAILIAIGFGLLVVVITLILGCARVASRQRWKILRVNTAKLTEEERHYWLHQLRRVERGEMLGEAEMATIDRWLED